jgi:hypothetical protein
VKLANVPTNITAKGRKRSFKMDDNRCILAAEYILLIFNVMYTVKAYYYPVALYSVPNALYIQPVGECCQLLDPPPPPNIFMSTDNSTRFCAGLVNKLLNTSKVGIEYFEIRGDIKYIGRRKSFSAECWSLCGV